MGQSRCTRYALLLAPYTSENPVELLPVTATAQDAGLHEGHYFVQPVSSGCSLYWKQSPLSWLSNPLASALCGTHVCGDAILALPGPFDSEAEAQRLISSVLAKGSPRELPTAAQAASSAQGTAPTGTATASSSGQGSGQALEAIKQPGEGPAISAAEKASPALIGSAGLPLRPPCAAEGSLACTANSSSSDDSSSSSSGRVAPASPKLAAPASVNLQCGGGCADMDPRQQLMWAIASRATSISWSPSTPAAAAGAAAAQQGITVTPETFPPAPHPPVEAATGAGTAQQREGEGGAAANEGRKGCITAGLAAVEGEGGIALGSEGARSSPQAYSKCTIGEEHPHGGSPWSGARSEIIALIVAQSGYSSAIALLISQVCSAWRQAIQEERGMLRRLEWSCLRRRHALPAAGCGRHSRARALDESLPWLVLEAARAGSTSAAVVAARHLEHRDPCAAASFWGKAAKRGHPEAQARLGLAYYKGIAGLACDCEEAMLWLSRSAKQLIDLLGPAGPSPPAADGRVAGTSAGPLPAPLGEGEGPAARQDFPAAAGAAGTAGAAGAAPMAAYGGGNGSCEAGSPRGGLASLLMTREDCRRCLAQAAHILGLLYLDGEGVKSDLVAGIRWLKVAEQQGCMEAGKVLGSLYNTGQYG